MQMPSVQRSLPVQGFPSSHVLPSSGVPVQIPSWQVSDAVQGLPSSQVAPSGSGSPLQKPALQTSFAVQGLSSSQGAPAVRKGSPVQLPCSQVSFAVHGLSSSQGVPSSRSAVQLPSWQASFAVHGFRSSHGVPSGAMSPEQNPPRQTSLTVQGLPSSHSLPSGICMPPVQIPCWQLSLEVHWLPSSQGVPSLTGVCTQPSEPALGLLGSQVSSMQALKLLHWADSSHVKPQARDPAAVSTTSRATMRRTRGRCMEALDASNTHARDGARKRRLEGDGPSAALRHSWPCKHSFVSRMTGAAASAVAAPDGNLLACTHGERPGPRCLPLRRGAIRDRRADALLRPLPLLDVPPLPWRGVRHVDRSAVRTLPDARRRGAPGALPVLGARYPELLRSLRQLALLRVDPASRLRRRRARQPRRRGRGAAPGAL